jgi:PKD repeat protein
MTDSRLRRRALIALAALTSLAAPTVLFLEDGSVSSAAPTPANQAPVAELVLNPAEVVAGTTMVADGSGSTDDIAVTSWAFAWGDKTKDTKEPEATASHVYSKPGTYTVKLTVRDGKRKSASISKTITVIPTDKAGDTPPDAKVTAKKVVGGGAIIDGGASVDDRLISGYQYDFGDGERSVKQPSSTVRHHYRKSGNYTIDLPPPIRRDRPIRL